MELTAPFMGLLEHLSPVFNAPSFVTFQLLMAGWIMTRRHRYVTDLIISSDSVGNGHYSNYHRFFSQASWSLDALWKRVAHMAVTAFVGPTGAIYLAGDDTLCRKRGSSLFGVGMHHDPLISSRNKKLVSWGHDWVTVTLLVANPWWAPHAVFALPICARLYRNRQERTKAEQKKNKGATTKPTTKVVARRRTQEKKKQRRERRHQRRAAARQGAKAGNKPVATPHRTRPELLLEMLQLVVSWFPDRDFLVVVDSLYSGESVAGHLPAKMDLIGPVHPDGALYEPAPATTGTTRRGPKRKKGDRLPSLDAWAANRQRWEQLDYDQFGLHATLQVKTRQGLYYSVTKNRLLTFVLSRDVSGERPTRIYYCTKLDLPVRDILSLYSQRWAIEVMHHDVKQHLGFDEPANRTPLAVQRTAPMALVLYTLTIIWHAQYGHAQVQFPERPWYPNKSEPSFGDMLTTLRRITWEEQLSEVRPKSTLAKKNLKLITYLASLAG